MTIYGDDYVNITNGNIEALGYLDISSIWDINIANSILTSDGDYISITADNNIGITSSDIYAYSGDVEIDAGWDVAIDSSYIDAYGDYVYVGADNNIGITNSDIYAENGALTLEADYNIGIAGTWLYSMLNTVINSNNGNIEIVSSDIESEDGYPAIEAGYNVSITDSYLYGYDGAYVYGVYGNVTITGSEIDSDWVLDIYAGNSVEISSSTLDSDETTSIYADNNVTITATDIYALNDLEMTADSGSITIDATTATVDDDAVLIAGENVNITTTSLLDINEEGYIEASNGNVTLGLVLAGNALQVVTGGAIIDNNGDANNIVTPTLVMTAVNGIGTTDDPIETQVQTLTATNTVAGDIVITNNKDVTGDLTILSAANNGVGSVIIRNGDIASGTNGGAIFLGDGVTAYAAPTIVATASVELYANQQIVDRNNEADADTNDSATLDIQAGQDSVLYSTYGWIGDPNNPIEILIDGQYPEGHLFVYAGGLDPQTGLTSVNLTGDIIPYGIPEAYDGLVPPGLILFNYRVVGGSGDDGGLLPPGFLWNGPGIELMNFWNTSIAQDNIGIANEPGYFGRIMQKVLFGDWFETEEAPYTIDESLRQIIEGIVLVK